MFIIIKISSNLLQTISSFLTNDSKSYVTKNGKKLSRRKYSLRSLKIDAIEKYSIFEKKNLTENNNSNNN